MEPLDPDQLEAFTRRPEPGSHRITLRIGEREVQTLADLAPAPGRLLFVGLNPSPASVEAGHYHQGASGRPFWKHVIAAGILPRGTPVATADDALSALGHGLTDLYKDPTMRDLAPDDVLRAGVGHLWQRVALWRPAAIVLLYRRAAEAVAGRPLDVPHGVLEGVALAGRPCILLPDPSAPRASIEEGVLILRNLAAALPR